MLPAHRWKLRAAAARPRRSLPSCATQSRAVLVPPAMQSRPNIFDLEIRAPDVLYEMVVECDEQVVLPLGDAPGT